jgi:SAM-dependent methyltransferase
MPELSPAVWTALRCPACDAAVRRVADGAACAGCATIYPTTPTGALDLRLQRPRTVTLPFTIGPHPLAPPAVDDGPLQAHPHPAVDFAGLDVPRHLSPALMSYLPRARGATSLALDLGAGAATLGPVCARAGFGYVSLDHDGPRAAILGDAHGLPFADATFELVVSIAVLEHLRYPLVAMREVHRVLKPGGVFIGTVAFLEPFHADSFYHHTHLGTLSALRYAGLDVQRVAPSAGWTVLVAQASNALFPLLPRALAVNLVRPLDAVHRALWRARAVMRARPQERERLLGTTGAFEFVASRPV